MDDKKETAHENLDHTTPIGTAWADYYRPGMSSAEAKAFQAGYAAGSQHLMDVRIERIQEEWAWDAGDTWISGSEERARLVAKNMRTRVAKRYVAIGPWEPVEEEK